MMGHASTWLVSVLSAILLFYRNEDKINDPGSDLGHNDLLILGRSVAFCLAVKTPLAYASAVTYEAEQGVPPSDLQITMSEM